MLSTKRSFKNHPSCALCLAITFEVCPSYRYKFAKALRKLELVAQKDPKNPQLQAKVAEAKVGPLWVLKQSIMGAPTQTHQA